MKIDRKAFIEKFTGESRDIVRQINDGLLFLEKNPSDRQSHADIMRYFHTLKGTSKMMGFSSLSALAHRCEDIFSALSSGRAPLTGELADFLFRATGLIGGSLDAIGRGGEIDLDRFVTGMGEAIDAGDYERLSALEVPREGSDEGPAAGEGGRVHEVDTESVKIRGERLDSMLKDVNEVMIYYLNMVNTTQRLEWRIRELKKSKLLNAVEIEEYHRDFYGILKQYRDYLNKLEIYIGHIQESLFNLKMLPVSLVFDQLPRAVRDIARQLGKRVEISIDSQNSYLEKTIIERLGEPLVHIVRNAISHGIEAPDERKRAGKPDTGRITIKSYMESGSVIIRIRDDGRGIDTARLRETAVARGLMSKDAAAALSEDAALNLVFSPEISTSEGVDDVSGRGVGMPIVKSSIEEIKGSLSVTTRKGAGTEISILLPLTLSTIDALFVSIHGMVFAVPIPFIEEIVKLRGPDIFDVSRVRLMRHRKSLIRVIDPERFLMVKEAAPEKANYVLVVKAIDRRLGLFIQDIVNESEIVIKPLPAHLQRFKHIMGVTVNKFNEVSAILHVPTIIDRTLRDERDSRVKISATGGRRASVLVVDDARSVRELLRNLLENYHYEVDEAENGRDALNMLKSKKYHCVITDLMMPVMDGFGLIGAVRGDRDLRGLPLVVLSSVSDTETVERVRALGANRYIVKDRFRNDTLIKIVKRMVG